MFGSNFRDFVSQDAALQDQSSSERLIKSWHGFEKQDSGDSGNCSEDEEEQSTNGATRSEFQLTQSLLSKVKAGENNKYANSGKQAQLDLKRMNFVINGKTIDKKCVLGLCNKNNHLISNGNEDYRTFAKQVFTEMFKYVEADVPSDNILAELITNCNQAGYECAMYEQIQPILAQYNLTPKIFERTISICCDSAEFVSVEYSEVMHVLNFDNPEEKICELNNLLKFALKSQDGKVEYKDGKVTLTIPEQLKDYKAGSKSLLGDINRHFEDADNAVVESLVANIGEGPKSFVADPPAGVDSDVDNSFDIIPKILAFDKLVDIINKAKNGNYNDLDEVMSNIKEEKDDIPINPDLKNLKDFCSQELNLTAQTDHERVRKVIIEKIYRKENATVKGLVLLAIAANDTLVERYARVHEGILFTQDEELDSLLIGAGKRCYIKFLLEHLEKELDSILSWRGICEKLKRASSIGSQECVKAILNRFEDTESRNPAISSNLLHYAVEKGDYDLVNLLIKNGANVDIQDRNGKTALHYAVSSYGDVQNINKMVMLLVESNADIDAQDSDRKTALHYAATSNKDEIVRLLLKEGADETILDTVMLVSETKSFLFNVLHEEGLLHWAAGEDNIGRAKRLLAKGKDVNAGNSCGESPLSVAIERNCLEMVKLLLEKGARIGKKELTKAIEQGNLKVIELLVSKGAVITEKVIQYARGVYEKCEEDKKQVHSSVLTFLMDIHNKQLLKKAIEQGDLKKIKSYVKKGAVITEEIVQYAKNVCESCEKNRKRAHLEVLTSLEKTSKDQFEKAIELGELERVELFVGKGAVITEKAIQYARDVYKNCEEGKVYTAKYPGGMKAERQNRKKILDFLEEEIKSIRTDVSAATSSHEAPVNIDDEKKQAHVQPVESESKGDQQGSPPLLPQSSVSGDVEGTEASANAAVTIPEKVDSLVSDGEHGKIVSKEHQDDVLEKDFSSDDGNSFLGDPVPTSTNEISGRTDGTQNKEASFSAQNDLDLQNKSATVLSVDSDEEKQASPSNGVFYDEEGHNSIGNVLIASVDSLIDDVAKKEPILDTTNSRDGSTLEGDSDKQEQQPKSVPTPLVANENYGQVDDTQTTAEQLEEPISPSVPPTVHVSQDNINVQLSNSTPAVTATRSSTPTTQVVPVPAAPVPPVTSKSSGQEGNVQINGKQSTNPSNIANASSDVNSKPITKEPVAPKSNQQSSQPPLSSFDLSSPQSFVNDEVSSIAGDLRSEASTEDDVSSLDIADDECSEASSTVGKNPLIMDVTDEKEPLPSTAEPDFTLKSSNSPQSTKSSKLPTVATWTLAVAGTLAGVAASVACFAFGASLLVVGITAGVGACCLIAAAIIYYCNKPSKSLENSNAERVTPEEIKTSCCA